MKNVDYTGMTARELIEIFIESSAAQQTATLFDVDSYNRHADQIRAARSELWRRGPKVFAELIPLLRHQTAGVRLNAAINCLRIAPKKALKVLHALAAQGGTEESLHADRVLDLWHRGEFPPPDERLGDIDEADTVTKSR